ncbi:alpha/beta-hydrolase [Trametes elegans]|nr:alpha/beta-hydrolase [Trametes elegans]
MAFFTYRHQPLTTLYFLYTGLSLLLVRVPYWTIRYALPSKRPLPWSLGRIVLVKCYRVFIAAIFRTTPAIFATDHAAVEKSGKGDELGLVWVDPAPELVVDEIEEAARTNGIEAVRRAGYWYGKRGPDGKAGQPAGEDEKVIYTLHGGGFVMGSAHPSFPTSNISNRMLTYAKGYERIFHIDYRLASTDPLPRAGAFPAALVDALAGYKYLVRKLGFRPHNIVIMGESAGGNLGLQLTRYLAQHTSLPGLGHAPPRAQLLLSPTSDWGNTQHGPGSSFVRNRDNDMVHAFFDGWVTRALVGSLPPDAAWTNVWISPGSLRLPHPEGLFRDLPPTCLIVGGAEMTLDPVKTVRDRITADCGEGVVHYVEIPNGTHVPMIQAWHEPESTKGFEAAAKWLESLETAR